MGVCIHYLSISVHSDLYRCLQTDVACNKLMDFLFSYGRELYNFAALRLGDMESDLDEELDEELDYFVETYQELLGPNPQGKIDSFFAAVKSMKLSSPGIDQRHAMLEKSSLEIEERLKQVLSQESPNNAEKIVRAILWCDTTLHPIWGQSGETPPIGSSTLGLISPAAVKKGAEVLSRFTGQDLFPSSEDSKEGDRSSLNELWPISFRGRGDRNDWFRENYERWQSVYLAAAEQGEAFLVGVS